MTAARLGERGDRGARRGWRALASAWVPALVALLLAALAPAVVRAGDAGRCAGPAGPLQPFQSLAPGVWWLPAATGDSDASNRGQVSNLVLVRDASGPARPARWWLLGSGPSPAFGRSLACRLRQQLGVRVTDVISPWARPELVLGVAGLRAAPGGRALRHWAHADVAAAMAVQCPHCVDRLRLRLGTASADLDGDPIRLPEHRLQGMQGRLGPFTWWRLPRSDGRWVTVWRLVPGGPDAPDGAPAPALWIAHGLLQGSGPPDGRDASLAMLRDAARQLAVLAADDGPAARFLGEQGPLLPADAPATVARYWDELLQRAEAAVLRGDDETAPAPAWPGLPAGWAGAPWHALNWQRAWRQAEDAVLAPPPSLPAAPAASAAGGS